MTSTLTPSAPQEATVQNQPTTPKTSCGQHRVVGYKFVAGLMVCKACDLPADYHETVDEAAARKATAEWVSA
jgi:hypothetical protein